MQVPACWPAKPDMFWITYVNGETNDFTFTASTTFLVDGQFIINGTATFEQHRD